MKNHWVMDYETLVNCFLGVFEHYKEDEVKVFTIGKLRNDLPALLDFFDQNKKKKEWHISFNGLNFDSQITQFIMLNRRDLLAMSGERAGNAIYEKAQDCIARQNQRQWQEWGEKQLSIKQVDVFRLNHWDNVAKLSSLKSIQVSMNWGNVQDMPIDHTTPILTVPQLQEVAKYCRNDVASTKEVMKRSSKLISLRGNLTDTYGIQLYSASEPRISKELFLYFLAKKTKMRKYDLKQMRTFRQEIRVKDLILPYLRQNDFQQMQNLLQEFDQLVIHPGQTKGGFSYWIYYKDVKTKFGLGGIHGAKKGIYKAGDGKIIMSSDVTSFYPNLAIRNKWAPAHLPKQTFCDLYEWFFEERKKIPKKDPRNYVYKIVLNSTYGLSNDKNSFLYDPKFTMQITINGQLSLLLLNMMLAENIPEAEPIMQNTDGLEMVIPEDMEEKYLEICKQWEDLTKLQLEHEQYDKLIVPDVNNYIGVFKSKEVSKEKYAELQKDFPNNVFNIKDGKYYYGTTKCKGRFEYEGLALHKDNSFLIIRKALYHYFVHGVIPEDYLLQNRNIYDYCGRVKATKNWKFMEIKVTDGEYSEEELQKTLRFYVSQTGSKIVKRHKTDGREQQVVSDKWLQTVFNVYEDKPWEEYQVNDQYYLERIYREITLMEPEKYNSQISLF